MVNEDFRKSLKAYLDEVQDQDTVILDNPAFDSSILGITESGQLVYDYESMIREYINDNLVDDNNDKDDPIDPTSAQEFIDYNTIPAIGYMGEFKPIIVAYSKEFLTTMFN